MDLLESLIYGFISGFTEFLPVSSQAHQAIFMQIFGILQRDPIRDFLVHAAILAALFIGSRSLFSRIGRERRLAMQLKRKKRPYDTKTVYDLHLIKTAALPMLVLLLLYFVTAKLEFAPVYISVFLIINGVILMIPEYMRHGNKDSRSMTGLDAIMIGIGSALSALPGVSRFGTGVSIATARGADRQSSINWALLLSVPALVMFLGFDIINLFSCGIGTITFVQIAGYLFTAVSAFSGGYLSIAFIRYLADRTGFAGFAYYSWGAALFTFIIYLIT